MDDEKDRDEEVIEEVQPIEDASEVVCHETTRILRTIILRQAQNLRASTRLANLLNGRAH